MNIMSAGYFCQETAISYEKSKTIPELEYAKVLSVFGATGSNWVPKPNVG
jgi:hypothetical protein